MKSSAALFFVLATVFAGSASAAPPKLTGSWEAARVTDDERLYVTLKDMGKAEIVAEYDFTLPGQPGKRRGRSTSFATWAVKGDDVIITYSKIQDRLRYRDRESLDVIGLRGGAPALKPVGKPNPKSKIGSLILWKGPHDYRVKDTSAPASAAQATVPPRAEPLPPPQAAGRR